MNRNELVTGEIVTKEYNTFKEVHSDEASVPKSLLAYVWRCRWFGICCVVIVDLLLEGVNSIKTNWG